MSVTEALAPQTTQAETVIANPAEREQWLKGLLGTDYEHAAGLISQFAYNPETGQDALRHILSGEVIKTDGGEVAFGFHHEPSAGPNTYVDREHLALPTTTSRTRKEFAHRPFEPYRANSVINGHKKVKTQVGENGEIELVPQEGSMFPSEYDALAVMKTIVNARDHRDTAQDTQEKSGATETEGHWEMLDGKTMMKVRMRLDKNQRIESAVPIVRSYMNLTPEMIGVHLGL